MDTPGIVRLKIELDDTDPAVWRRVEVAASTTLKQLHHVVQAAMGWHDSHLHEFEIGRRRPAGSTSLADLAAAGTKRFGYLYDMGDSWQHSLRIERVQPAEPGAAYPRLTGGAGRCPPEDCGGIPGFYEFLDALADPGHPDHDDLLDWHGGPFDPLDMDVEAINKRLAGLAGRRRKKPKRAD
jgi:hypothetical protein